MAFGVVLRKKSAYGQESGALTVTLDLQKELFSTVEVFVKSDGAATFIIEGSRNGITFREADQIVLAVAGESTELYGNAYPIVRVRVDNANVNEVEIHAS